MRGWDLDDSLASAVSGFRFAASRVVVASILEETSLAGSSSNLVWSLELGVYLDMDDAKSGLASMPSSSIVLYLFTSATYRMISLHSCYLGVGERELYRPLEQLRT